MKIESGISCEIKFGPVFTCIILEKNDYSHISWCDGRKWSFDPSEGGWHMGYLRKKGGEGKEKNKTILNALIS